MLANAVRMQMNLGDAATCLELCISAIDVKHRRKLSVGFGVIAWSLMLV